VIVKAAQSALVVLFALPMALWPLLWLFALGRHALRGRRRRMMQVALLLPLWTVAASIGAIQLPVLLAALQATPPSPRWWIAATSVGVAACIAVLAWLLLVRSWGAEPAKRP
jgi:uncharacterized membrane protein